MDCARRCTKGPCDARVPLLPPLGGCLQPNHLRQMTLPESGGQALAWGFGFSTVSFKPCSFWHLSNNLSLKSPFRVIGNQASSPSVSLRRTEPRSSRRLDCGDG